VAGPFIALNARILGPFRPVKDVTTDG